MKDISQSEKERINNLLNIIKTTHSVNIKNICKDLKCSREFATKYVLSAFIDDRVWVGRKESDYLRIFQNTILDRGYYYNQDKYIKFIFESIKKMTQQTILIDNNILYNNYPKFKEKILKNKNDFANGLKSFNTYRKERLKLINEHITDIGNNILKEKKPNKTKRKATAELNIKYKINIDIKKLTTALDMLDYGDSREAIEKKVYSYGFLRIEINFLDNIKKIYYYDLNDGHYEDKTLVTYKAYEKHILNIE